MNIPGIFHTSSRKLFLLLLLLIFLPYTNSIYAQEDDDDFFVFDEDEDDFFMFDEDDDNSQIIADPFENINRITFSLNNKLYRGVLKPIARGLRVIPVPVRNSGARFFVNLGTPVSAISALLQFDLPNTGTELSRFLINSTIGLLGFFDPATKMGLIRDNEDIGQTLGRYGIGHGFYLVIPFIGSSSLRDMVGRTGNAAINPVNNELDNGEILALNLVSAEISLSLDQDTYEAFYDSALDPYIFFRSAYIQNRAGVVEE